MDVAIKRILTVLIMLSATTPVLRAQDSTAVLQPEIETPAASAVGTNATVDDTMPASGGDTVPSLPTDTPIPGTDGGSSHSSTTDSTAASAEQSPSGATIAKKVSDAATDVQSLDRMVVSATRSRRRMSETPASVSVISRQEIDRSSAKDINDLIANKTGVQVRRAVGMGEGVPSDIVMRGIPGALAATRTLILVDGIPTNASGTPFLILNEIPVEIIDNIEIVRGPFSSLYGANAFSGVINVVTKKGDGRPGVGGTFETSYPFSVANAWFDDNPIRDAVKVGARQALWNGDLMSSGGNERLHYLVNGGYRTIGNYYLNDSALVKSADTTYRIPAKNYNYHDVRLFGKFGWKITDRLTLDLHTRYFKSGLGYGVTRFVADTTIDINMNGEKIIVGPQLSFHLNDKIDLKAVGYIRRLVGGFTNEMDQKPVSWASNTHDWQVDLQGIIRPTAHHILTAGTEFLSNRIAFGDVVDLRVHDGSILEKGVKDRITNAGAYLQDEWIINERLTAVPGIRVDYHTVFGYAVSPKLGISAKATDALHLRSSFGRAFRAPNHSELFLPPMPIGDSIILGSNPNLTPEYIWAADGGVDVLPLENLKIQCGVFYNWMKDLIGQGVNLQSSRVMVTHENISRAWSTGVELEAEWRPVRGVTLQGSYVFQQSRNESASENARYMKSKPGRDTLVDETKIPLDYIPTNKGSIGASFSHRFGPVQLTLSVDELIVGKRIFRSFNDIKIDAQHLKYIMLNSDNTIRVNPPLIHLPLYARTDVLLRCAIGDHLFATVSAQNCFDARYEESFGNYAPGRLATLKVGVNY